uniref:Uncharacterized protein n=1 Tax=Parascaris equorum TaxID=6256 RepID=A0A914R4H4_PAREQ
MALKQTLTATAALIRSKIAPNAVPAESLVEDAFSSVKAATVRSRRTLSEGAAQESESHHCQSSEALSCDTDVENEFLSPTGIRQHTLIDILSPGIYRILLNTAVVGVDIHLEGTTSFDVDMQTDSNHDTALTLAASGGHDTLVELLIARGADIEHHDKKV